MSCLRLLSLALVALLTVAESVVAEERTWPSERLRGRAPEQPACTCRSPAGSVEVGQELCLSTPDGGRRARCVMVLNNTSWTLSTETCGLRPPLTH